MGTEITTIHQGRINAVAFSPDWKTIVSGSQDRTIMLREDTMGRMFSELMN
jgi:WD40 repeat protein